MATSFAWQHWAQIPLMMMNDGGMWDAPHWKRNTLCLCNCFISLRTKFKEMWTWVTHRHVLWSYPEFISLITLTFSPFLTHHMCTRCTGHLDRVFSPLTYRRLCIAASSWRQHLKILQLLEAYIISWVSTFLQKLDKQFRSFILSGNLSNFVVILPNIMC